MPLAVRLELDLDGHADVDGVVFAAADAREHGRSLFELEQSHQVGQVRDEGPGRRQGDQAEGADRGAPARSLPVELVREAARAVAARGEYCVSKAGAAMISKVFAVRLAADDICVFDVQPGIIRTDMTQPVIDTYDKRIQEEDFTLIKRIGEPEDIGVIVATLASGGMPYVTGQEISADAGLVLPRF